MFGVRVVMNALLAVSTLGISAATYAADDIEKLHSDLEHISQLRIFFGHQSVGDNLLEGIEQLSSMARVPVKIEKVKEAKDVKLPMIGNAYIAENEFPFKKLKSFEDDMGSKQTDLDIALMKFCYVDIKADTDSRVLFARYQATIEGLKAKHPETTFVHVTAPLTSEKSGPKEFLKRLLGRSDSAANVRREEYNALLRKSYQGREPIFDLAHVESTNPNGSAVTVEWNGIVAPAMAQEYTNDGGHLNAEGKLRAARELISVLATIPVQPSPHGPTR